MNQVGGRCTPVCKFCFVAETNSFVKLLFEVLTSGEYDAELKAKRAAANSAPRVAKEPTLIPVTRVSTAASSSGTAGGSGSIGSHGDVDMRSTRPGAVVQPLMAANSGVTTDDKDYRHTDVYRPGYDDRHRGEPPQHRRDWKRSPQRMVR